MKIAVIGPGSMGLLYGVKLSAVAQVSLIGRDEEKIRQINEKGITLKRGEDSFTRRVPAFLTGKALEAADVVLLFTKAYQLAKVLEENRGAHRGGYPSTYPAKRGRP